MKILHMLTTGSSLLEKIKERRQDEYGPLTGVLVPGAVGPDTVHEMLGGALSASSTAVDLDALLTPAQRSLLASVSADDAAEWSSVRAVGNDPARFPVASEESFVFVASDTDDGLRAATFLAVGHDTASVHYVPEPLDHTAGWVRPGQAWICRVPRLDLGTTRPDGRTWRSLGAVGRLVADTVEQDPSDWTVVVHFSGGYKAIVPYVMVLAEDIRSRLAVSAPRARHDTPVSGFSTSASAARSAPARTGTDSGVRLEWPVMPMRTWYLSESVVELGRGPGPGSTRPDRSGDWPVHFAWPG